METPLPTSDPASFERFFTNKIKNIQQEVRKDVYAAADLGVEEMQHLISVRGTAKGGRRPEIAGRIDTGQMKNDVDRKRSGNQHFVTAKFGWVKNREDYYVLQEEGFRHRGGVSVEAMYALQDAYESVTSALKQDIDRAVRDA